MSIVTHLIAFFFGAGLGISTMCMARVASQMDEQLERRKE